MSIHNARNATEKYLPGLLAALRERGLMALEQADPAVLCGLFRDYRAAGLIIPETYGGLGASPEETVEILRAIGSLCPSLAVMMTMHHHTIATIVQLGGLIPAAEELLWGITQNQLLIASAFAEGKPGSEIFNRSVKARPVEGGFVLDGSKKPCTMSHHMDVIVVGVACEQDDGSVSQGFAVVFADGSTVTREPFWNATVLRATDSNELVFNGVFVPSERMLLADGADSEEVAATAMETSLNGLSWFQLMVGGSYLGVASALVDRLLRKAFADPAQLALLCIELEGAHQALLGTAGELQAQQDAPMNTYHKALCTRFWCRRRSSARPTSASSCWAAWPSLPPTKWPICWRPPGRSASTRSPAAPPRRCWRSSCASPTAPDSPATAAGAVAPLASLRPRQHA